LWRVSEEEKCIHQNIKLNSILHPGAEGVELAQIIGISNALFIYSFKVPGAGSVFRLE
jgi:hypothetical protein